MSLLNLIGETVSEKHLTDACLLDAATKHDLAVPNTRTHTDLSTLQVVQLHLRNRECGVSDEELHLVSE